MTVAVLIGGPPDRSMTVAVLMMLRRMPDTHPSEQAPPCAFVIPRTQ